MNGTTRLSATQVVVGAYKIIIKDSKRRIKLTNCFSNYFGGSGQTGRFVFNECHLISRPNTTWAVMTGFSDNKGPGNFFKTPFAALSITSKDKSDYDIMKEVRTAWQGSSAFSPIVVVVTRTGRLVRGGKFSVFSPMMKEHLEERYDYDRPSSNPTVCYVASLETTSRGLPARNHRNELVFPVVKITGEAQYHVRADAALADCILETLAEIRLSKK